MAQTIDFVSLLHKSQEYISENYAAALSDRSKIVQLRSYIEKYLHDSGFEVEGMTFRELADKLYSEMAEYSVLTKYLGRDEIEEININGWDDIAVTYTDGHIEKAKEHFYNPQHAVDVVKRLLHHSGMIIDNATPMSQGHLPGNTRITALKEPLVDNDRGISVSMLVVLDSILNRITANRAKGKNTFIIIDEIYLLFQHEYSANFLFTLWKRVRKYGAFCTGITQNVDDLLQSHTARTMLANSEFVIMLNQASTDRIKLAELLNISDTQISYITNVEAGRGLMKVGSALVPFVNKFPKNTQLYRLMTTKPGEQ